MASNSDKTVLITGASRGIGAASAVAAAAAGWRVCINFRKCGEEAESLVSRIQQAGGEAAACQADVGNEAEVLSLFEFVDKRFGKLDALVNNAGIITPSSRLVDMDCARLERIFRVNITGSFLCAREAVKRMSTRLGGNGGSIVNLSSAASRLGAPGEFIDYASSKGAIDTFTLGLAKEVGAEGIRVNGVRPGLIETDIHADTGDLGRSERLRPLVPMQRIGTADEVATCIVWLLSEQASYVAGALLDVSGGR
ncbi:MAG: SDR family oxidoreductase [Gammaproteobacteria bacterium]|nr:SDR family oxidoreductase [Pseudomonadales bacterium]